MRIQAVALIVLLALVAGCSPVPPVALEAPAPVRPMQATLADTVGGPTLVELAGWLNRYRLRVVPLDAVHTWSACFPATGAPVDRFVWEVQFRRSVDAPGVPAATAAALELRTELALFTDPVDQDSVRVRVVGIAVGDSAEVAGPWSRWGTWSTPPDSALCPAP